MHLKKIIYRMLTFLLSTCIFGFSAQPGEVSGGMSERVADLVVQVANRGGLRIDPSHESEQFQQLHTLVRKAAHFCIYAALGFCVCGFCMATRLSARPWLAGLLAVLFCFLYACTDEFHQSFVGGRGPAATDVLIDSAGALVGVPLQVAVCLFFGKRFG